MIPLSIGMTPSYYDEGHWLLQAQLRCLSEQVSKDFDVWLIDPHYSARKDVIPELAEKYRLRIVHVPYRPNLFIAKKMDCAIFNAVYCYSQSPKIVRYSCWRFVRPTWTEEIMKCPPKVNMDFDWHNIEAPAPKRHPQSDHDASIWNYGSDRVCWFNMTLEKPSSSYVIPVQPNCYGNVMWTRENWLSINGTDEVFTNTLHSEDLDFCIRAGSAGHRIIRSRNLMYRLHHHHGNHDGYANRPIDYPFRQPCASCRLHTSGRYKTPSDFDADRRARVGDIDLLDDVWVCKRCKLSCARWNIHQFCDQTRRSGKTQARIVPQHRIGRNLQILASDMDKTDLQGKISVYNDSWSNDRYYMR